MGDSYVRFKNTLVLLSDNPKAGAWCHSNPGGKSHPYPNIGLASRQPSDIGPPMLPTMDWGLEHSDEHLSEQLVIPIPCPRVWLKPGMGTVGVAGDGDPGTRQCCCLITSSMAKSVTKFLLLAQPWGLHESSWALVKSQGALNTTTHLGLLYPELFIWSLLILLVTLDMGSHQWGWYNCSEVYYPKLHQTCF